VSTEEPSLPAEPAPKPVAEPWGWLPPFLRRHVRGLKIGAVLAGVGTVLSLLVTVLDLWDRVFDGDDVKPVPTLTVERELTTDVPWGDYLKAHPDASTRPSYTEAQLTSLGEEFRVTGQVEGRGGKRAVLTWEVFQPPGVPLTLPAWAPRRAEQKLAGDGRVEFRPWIAVPEGAGELYPKFALEIEGTNRPPAVTGPTLTIGRN